ncbi:MAG: hypothetical protein WDA29_11400 [Flavobacteriaceae bacterium]
MRNANKSHDKLIMKIDKYLTEASIEDYLERREGPEFARPIKRKIGPARASKMTPREVKEAIYAGAGVATPRSPSDAFTTAGLKALLDNPKIQNDFNLVDWIYSCLLPDD